MIQRHSDDWFNKRNKKDLIEHCKKTEIERNKALVELRSYKEDVKKTSGYIIKLYKAVE